MGNCGSDCNDSSQAVRRHTESEMLLNYLSEKELNIIRISWPLAKQQHNHFCAQIVVEILKRSHQVRQIFNIVDVDLDVRPFHQKVIGQADKIESFLNELIKDLSEDRVYLLCTNLGAGHLAYRKSGFQPVYWDLFTACMIEKFQTVQVPGQEKKAVINAWQKFCKFVVGTMYAAYEQAANRADMAPSKIRIKSEG